jgi:hypothetical protein
MSLILSGKLGADQTQPTQLLEPGLYTGNWIQVRSSGALEDTSGTMQAKVLLLVEQVPGVNPHTTICRRPFLCSRKGLWPW